MPVDPPIVNIDEERRKKETEEIPMCNKDGIGEISKKPLFFLAPVVKTLLYHFLDLQYTCDVPKQDFQE